MNLGPSTSGTKASEPWHVLRVEPIEIEAWVRILLAASAILAAMEQASPPASAAWRLDSGRKAWSKT